MTRRSLFARLVAAVAARKVPAASAGLQPLSPWLRDIVAGLQASAVDDACRRAAQYRDIDFLSGDRWPDMHDGSPRIGETLNLAKPPLFFRLPVRYLSGQTATSNPDPATLRILPVDREA